MATMQCGFVRMKFSLLFYSPEVFTSIYLFLVTHKSLQFILFSAIIRPTEIYKVEKV